jgi:[ribosomal protein S18]-alanine N-acetyltransferase
MSESGFRFRELTRADADSISRWKYPQPYSLYDGSGDADRLLKYKYFAGLDEEGGLVGFCCFGEDARVPGLDEEEGVLDVGAGLRPDLTGIGLGGPFLREACRFGGELYKPSRFRVVIASFNDRAQMVAHALGFEAEDTVRNDEKNVFIVMTREV